MTKNTTGQPEDLGPANGKPHTMPYRVRVRFYEGGGMFGETIVIAEARSEQEAEYMAYKSFEYAHDAEVI